MKEGDAALLESLLRLKKEGYRPKRDLIAAFTADEEAGYDANGPEYLLKNRRELIEAGLAVNLDGASGLYRGGKRVAFMVGTSEKTYVTYTLETTSAGGHGSLPGPDNAIYRLAAGLGRIEALRFPVTLTATTRAYFAKLAELDPDANSNDLRALAAPRSDGAAAERLSRSVIINALLRTTCVATLVSGGHAENALPQRARATIQCRMMPGDSAEHVQAVLTETLHDPQVRVTMDAPPILSPESLPNAAIMSRFAGVVNSMWPGVPLVPALSTGYSDGRQTRSAGIPTYEVAGVWHERDENRAHGRDERVGVREFDESVEYTYRLLREMGKAD
jgi:acetylornithine deacetylase/succinyl-diaminopimelate desuccinylase-like protein